MSVALYAVTLRYDLHLTTYPNGFWSFNPFAWQLLFVFGAWCALGGARRMSRISVFADHAVDRDRLSVGGVLRHPDLVFPAAEHLMPHWLEQWIYPINKTDLDVLRFAHFLALAVIAVRFVPAGWPGLESRWLWPMILCGQNSLEIFCLGVALAFTGYFVLTEFPPASSCTSWSALSESDHVSRGMAVLMVQILERPSRMTDGKSNTVAPPQFALEMSVKRPLHLPDRRWS